MARHVLFHIVLKKWQHIFFVSDPIHPHNNLVNGAVLSGGASLSKVRSHFQSSSKLRLRLMCRSAFNSWFRGNHGRVNDEGLTSVYSRGQIHPEWWRLVPRRPRHRGVWPAFSPPSLRQTSSGINAFSAHNKDVGAPCLLQLMSSEVRSCSKQLSFCLTSWLNICFPNLPSDKWKPRACWVSFSKYRHSGFTCLCLSNKQCSKSP